MCRQPRCGCSLGPADPPLPLALQRREVHRLDHAPPDDEREQGSEISERASPEPSLNDYGWEGGQEDQRSLKCGSHGIERSAGADAGAMERGPPIPVRAGT